MSVQTPHVTDHALLRYQQRVDPVASRGDVLAAYDAATDDAPSSVDHMDGRHSFDPDSGAVFITKLSHGRPYVTTVVLADPSRGGQR